MSILSEEELEALTGRNLLKNNIATSSTPQKTPSHALAKQLENKISDFLSTNIEVRYVPFSGSKKTTNTYYEWFITNSTPQAFLYIDKNILEALLNHLSSTGQHKKESWIKTGPIGEALRSFFLVQISSPFLEQQSKNSIESQSFSIRYQKKQGFIEFKTTKEFISQDSQNLNSPHSFNNKNEANIANLSQNNENEANIANSSQNNENEANIANLSQNNENLLQNDQQNFVSFDSNNLPWFKREILKNAKLDIKIKVKIEIPLNNHFFQKESNTLHINISSFGQLSIKEQILSNIRINHTHLSPIITTTSHDESPSTPPSSTEIHSTCDLILFLSPLSLKQILTPQNQPLNHQMIENTYIELSHKKRIKCQILSWKKGEQKLLFESKK